MIEFLQQLFRRRENPVDRYLARSRGVGTFVWKMGLLLLACVGCGFVGHLIETRNWGQILLLVFPFSYALLVPLSFLLFLSRRLTRDLLEELSLTNLTPAEIAYGWMWRPFLRGFIPFLLWVPLLYFAHHLTGRSEVVFFSCVLFGLSLLFHQLMSFICLRQFSANVGRPGRAFTLSVLNGALLLFLLFFYFAFLGALIYTFKRSGDFWQITLMSVVGLCMLFVASRGTFGWFPDRMMETVQTDATRRTTWSGNEIVSDEERALRSKSLAQLRRFCFGFRSITVTLLTALLICLVTCALYFGIAGNARSEVFGAIIFRHAFSVGIVILVTVVYLLHLRRRAKGVLPLVAGALPRSVMIYAFFPTAFALAYLSIPVLMNLGYGEGDFMLRLISAPCAWFMVLAIAGSLILSPRPKLKAFLWVAAGVLSLYASTRVIAEAANEYWSPRYGDFIEMRPNGILHIVPMVISAYVMWMAIIGFTRRLQRLHDQQVIGTPRGELTASIS